MTLCEPVVRLPNDIGERRGFPAYARTCRLDTVTDNCLTGPAPKLGKEQGLIMRERVRLTYVPDQQVNEEENSNSIRSQSAGHLYFRPTNHLGEIGRVSARRGRWPRR